MSKEKDLKKESKMDESKSIEIDKESNSKKKRDEKPESIKNKKSKKSEKVESKKSDVEKSKKSEKKKEKKSGKEKPKVKDLVESKESDSTLDSEKQKENKEKETKVSEEATIEIKKRKHDSKETNTEKNENDKTIEKEPKKPKREKVKGKSKPPKVDPVAEGMKVAKRESLSYLSEWKHSRSTWKFKKSRQLWLCRNAFKLEAFDDVQFKVLKEYLVLMQGNLTEMLVSGAKKTLESIKTKESESKPDKSSEDQEEPTTENVENEKNKIKERAESILELFIGKHATILSFPNKELTISTDSYLPTKETSTQSIWTKRELSEFKRNNSNKKIIAQINPFYDLIAISCGSLTKVARFADKKTVWTHNPNSNQKNKNPGSGNNSLAVVSVCWKPDGKELAILYNNSAFEILEYQAGKIQSYTSLDLTIACTNPNTPNSPETTKNPESRNIKPVLFTWIDFTDSKILKKESVQEIPSFIQEFVDFYKEKSEKFTDDMFKDTNLNGILVISEHGELFVCINGVYVLKPRNLLKEISNSLLLKNMKTPSIKSASVSSDLQLIDLILQSTQDETISNFHDGNTSSIQNTYKYFRTSLGINVDLISKSIQQSAILSYRILKLTNDVQFDISELVQIQNRVETEMKNFELLKEKFWQIILDNGFETTTSLLNEMTRVLVTGCSSNPTMQFFLTKVKEKELKQYIREISVASESTIKIIVKLQTKLQKLLELFGNYRALIIRIHEQNNKKLIKESNNIVECLMWLYGYLEQFVAILNRRSNDFLMLISWMLFVRLDLEWQNNNEQEGALDENDRIKNPFGNNLLELSRVITRFFQSERDSLVETRNKKTILAPNLIPKFYPNVENSNYENDEKKLESFFSPVCPKHQNTVNCHCIEDGIPNDLIGNGISREYIVSAYFKTLRNVNSCNDVLGDEFSAFHSKFFQLMNSKTFSENTTAQNIIDENPKITKSSRNPVISFHSNSVLYNLSNFLKTNYAVPPPTLPESVEFISNSTRTLLKLSTPEISTNNKNNQDVHHTFSDFVFSEMDGYTIKSMKNEYHKNIEYKNHTDSLSELTCGFYCEKNVSEKEKSIHLYRFTGNEYDSARNREYKNSIIFTTSTWTVCNDGDNLNVGVEQTTISLLDYVFVECEKVVFLFQIPDIQGLWVGILNTGKMELSKDTVVSKENMNVS
ncbi:hypothetical protein BB559_002128 [Furculomyces boomerangus]|uniref:Anaphase-promoting complex subunit 4 WD40 domain-containing protein n=1 Tax=Furculomyces boomerangus TaxID=61424 RepID=A0A2T9YXX3_9FUNG|nr:hypothetical protein BB559_002128 [Furculomyces boomerangus]